MASLRERVLDQLALPSFLPDTLPGMQEPLARLEEVFERSIEQSESCLLTGPSQSGRSTAVHWCLRRHRQNHPRLVISEVWLVGGESSDSVAMQRIAEGTGLQLSAETAAAAKPAASGPQLSVVVLQEFERFAVRCKATLYLLANRLHATTDHRVLLVCMTTSAVFLGNVDKRVRSRLSDTVISFAVPRSLAVVMEIARLWLTVPGSASKTKIWQREVVAFLKAAQPQLRRAMVVGGWSVGMFRQLFLFMMTSSAEEQPFTLENLRRGLAHMRLDDPLSRIDSLSYHGGCVLMAIVKTDLANHTPSLAVVLQKLRMICISRGVPLPSEDAIREEFQLLLGNGILQYIGHPSNPPDDYHPTQLLLDPDEATPRVMQRFPELRPVFATSTA
eukprot:TRINITY_DN18536_c0_g1_i2.p1 TRINITY_DN18536_c0_g1~~TRINITY_DN18536_c0_g1_i2.p1  ORF type:complete len:389 (+),score=67.40 TRINITY_DN18536_c0_g1_i2:44-1210(+)